MTAEVMSVRMRVGVFVSRIAFIVSATRLDCVSVHLSA